MLNNLFLSLAQPDFYKHYKNLKKNQTISVDRKQSLSLLLKAATDHVPYYKALSISDKTALQSFPLLTKKIIKQSFTLLKNISIPDNRFIKDGTSGSTGESTYFLRDAQSLYKRHACADYGDSFTGWELGEPRFIIWGAERDIKTTWKRKIAHSRFFHNIKMVSSYYMTENDMSEYVAQINSFKPTLIVGYPSTMELFANYIYKKGGLKHKPKAIVTGGETLYEYQREIIQQTFQTKVFNRYGCREVGIIANECSKQSGLHIHSSNIYLEVLNEFGQPAKPGELGEIVITDLINFAFPFIRYRIGDLGILSDRKCSCGINSPILEKVEGRSFDLIIGTNGNRVPGNFFTLLRNKIKGVVKFQVIQEVLGKLIVIIVVNELYTNHEKEILLTELKKKLGEDMQIELKIVDDIDVSQTGKFRFVISHVSPFHK